MPHRPCGTEKRLPTLLFGNRLSIFGKTLFMIYLKFNIEQENLMKSLKGVNNDIICVLIPNVKTDDYYIVCDTTETLEKLLPHFLKFATNDTVVTKSELLKVSPIYSGKFLHTMMGNIDLLPW